MRLPWPLRDIHLARLVRLARLGRADAFEALYRELYPVVSGHVARRVARRADAEDLVALTFHRLLDALPRLDPARSPLPFALSVARNAIADHLRAHREAAPMEAAAAVAGGPDPLDTLLRREEARALRAQLAALPAEAREVLALRYGDGLRFAEIAPVIGTTEAAARQRCARALRELRESLGNPGTEALAHDP